MNNNTNGQDIGANMLYKECCKHLKKKLKNKKRA